MFAILSSWWSKFLALFQVIFAVRHALIWSFASAWTAKVTTTRPTGSAVFAVRTSESTAHLRHKSFKTRSYLFTHRFASEKLSGTQSFQTPRDSLFNTFLNFWWSVSQNFFQLLFAFFHSAHILFF